MAKLTKAQRGELRTVLACMELAQARIKSPAVMITAHAEGRRNCIKATDPALARLTQSISNLAHFLIYN